MKIGEVARATGATVEMIRYYEREKLLDNARRTGNNYRRYDETTLQRLTFIRHCRTLDMTLAEIRTLLQYQDAPTNDCSEVNRLLDEHLAHVSERIKSLRELQTQLKHLREQCRVAQSTDDCGILQALARPTEIEHEHRHGGHISGTHSKSERTTRAKK